MDYKTAPSFNVEIHMAGDIAEAGRIIQRFVDKIGLCVTLTPQSFIYTGGREEGFKVGLINYPRFPKEPMEIVAVARILADILREPLGQDSYSIVTPTETSWWSYRPKDYDGLAPDPAPPSQGEAYHSDTIEGAKRLAQADFDRRIIGVAVIQRDDVLDDLHSTVCLLETMAEALPADDASGVMMSVMAENMRKKHFGGETEVKQ